MLTQEALVTNASSMRVAVYVCSLDTKIYTVGRLPVFSKRMVRTSTVVS